MTETTKTHWPSFFILIVLVLGMFVFLVAALGIGIASLVGLLDGSGDPAGLMIQSVAAGFELLLLMICAWFVLQKITQKQQADLPIPLPSLRWFIFLIPLIVLACIGIGASVSLLEIKWLAWLLLPVLTLPIILLPILFFLQLGVPANVFPSRWKVFATLGLSMTAGPLVMIFLEIMSLLFVALLAAVFISSEPELMSELSRLPVLLNEEASPDEMIELLAPYITRPSVVTGIFLYLALIVPLIEELFKPLAVWLFASSTKSAASGFALGMLCGGAFALVESLNASSDGSAGWFAIVTVRAGTSLLHMATSGLMGYAIVQLFQEGKYGRMLTTYLACVLLHGLWNACAVVVGLGSLGEMLGKPEWLWRFIPAGVTGIMVLGMGMLWVLVSVHRRMRAQAPQEGIAVEKG
jgi:RsiW-degrading membrane proteinase PrsW (M82 family)